MSIKIEVFKMTDFDVLGDTSHKSISGGIATHDLYHCGNQYVSELSMVLPAIKEFYGVIPYIFDDRLEFQISESETLSFYITEIQETKYDNTDLKQFFPDLEEN